MERIAIDNALRVQLDACWAVAEICDQTGRKLGHFVPVSASEGSNDCPFSEEELAKMQQEKGGRTLPEIWKSLT